MANSFLKAEIRLDKIATRNNKPHYSHLTKEQYNFVKVFDKVKQFEKEIGYLDFQGEDKDWRKKEFGIKLIGDYLRAVDKQIKLSNDLKLTEIEENSLYASCHTSRFYGGSY